MSKTDTRTCPLPWLQRDHERLHSLLQEIRAAVDREAMSFVIHRMLEELRTLCHAHFVRRHHALVRLGLGEADHRETETVKQELTELQRQIRRTRRVDYQGVRAFIDRWQGDHFAHCEKTLVEAAQGASHATRWDVVHGGASRPARVPFAIPVDPQTSGAFLV